MSFYTPEASLIVYRIAVLAPTAKDLSELFQDWAMQIESDLKPLIKTQMRHAANFEHKGPGAQAWLSAHLGSRGSVGLRISLIGYNAEISLPRDEVLRRLDALWVWADLNTPGCQEYLKLGSSAAPIEIPTLVIFSEKKEDFLQKALQLWSKRQVQPSKALYGRENSLRKGLEWALSFS